MNKVKGLVAGVFGLLVLAACSGQKEQKTMRSIVRVAQVVAADSSDVWQYPGRVVSNSNANLSFRVPGQLKRVLVGEGDRVRAGQLLAELDDSDYKIQLNATQAEYDQIKADAERVIALYKENGTTASNYDKARYGLEQITAKLQNHKNQLAYTKLYAPHDGYIQKKFFDANETVAAGMPVVDMLGDGGLEVEINLPAQMYIKRDALRSFECTLDVLPGEVLPLQLISILPNANSNQLYAMRLRLEDKTRKVAPGMSAWVSVHAGLLPAERVCVPATALLHEGGQSYVFLYNKDNATVKRTVVRVCELHRDGTAVVSGQVTPHDQVVSSGVHHIEDGQQVELLLPVSKTNVGGLL